jgi:hypothetical protein
MPEGLSYKSQLADYLKKNLKKGYTKESLKWALVSQGHSKIEIEKAFSLAEEEMAREAPVLKTKPKITREVIEPQIDLVEHKTESKSFLERLFG